MKKLIYIFAACFMSALGMAQKITNTELQGNWKLSGFNQNGVTVDVASGSVSISQEMKTQLTADMLNEIDKGVKQSIGVLKTSEISFTGNAVKQNIAGKEKNGTYNIKDSDGRQVMTTTWSDSSKTETTVWIKDKKLYIFKYEQGQSAEFVFDRA